MNTPDQTCQSTQRRDASQVRSTEVMSAKDPRTGKSVSEKEKGVDIEKILVWWRGGLVQKNSSIVGWTSRGKLLV